MWLYIMPKFKILVPLVGSETSMHSLDWLKKFYSKDDAEVTLINVVEIYYSLPLYELKNPEIEKNESNRFLNVAAHKLEGYKDNEMRAIGYAPDEILKEATNGKYDFMIMTKSSVKGISRMIGSVTTKVVRDSEIPVIVIPA